MPKRVGPWGEFRGHRRFIATVASVATLIALVVLVIPQSALGGLPGGGGGTCTGYIDVTSVSSAPGIKMTISWSLSTGSGYSISNFEFLYGINTQVYTIGPSSWTSNGVVLDLSAGAQETIYYEIVAVVTGPSSCDSYIYHDGTAVTFQQSSPWAGIEVSGNWAGPPPAPPPPPPQLPNQCWPATWGNTPPGAFSGSLQATQTVDTYLDGQVVQVVAPTPTINAWSSWPSSIPLCWYTATFGPTVNIPVGSCSVGSGAATVYAAQLTVEVGMYALPYIPAPPSYQLQIEMGLEACANGYYYGAYNAGTSTIFSWEALASDLISDYPF
jgi:hypothetical protein